MARHSRFLRVFCLGALVSAGFHPAGSAMNYEAYDPLDSVYGPDGSFYGVLAGDGAAGGGKIYRIGPQGAIKTIARLPRLPWAPYRFTTHFTPDGKPCLGPDGALYGGVGNGGVFGNGFIYKLELNGKLTFLHDLEWSERFFSGGVASRDGTLYLAASDGIFRLRKSGDFTILRTYPFFPIIIVEDAFGRIVAGCDNGEILGLNAQDQFDHIAKLSSGPRSILALADGSLVIACENTVQQIHPDGTVESLHAFYNGIEGRGVDSLFLTGEGDLIGTTQSAGSFGMGTVFQITAEPRAFSILKQLEKRNSPSREWIAEVLPFRVASLKGNLPPVARDDTVDAGKVAAGHRSLTGGGWKARVPSVKIDVLNNDSDADNDPLHLVSVGTPAHGAALIDANGRSVTYVSGTKVVCNDQFTYTVSDSKGATATASVFIRTNPAGNYDGFVYDPSDALGWRSISLKLGANGALSGSVFLYESGRAISFLGKFNEANHFSAVLSHNDRTGQFLSVQLFLRPQGDGWYIDATMEHEVDFHHSTGRLYRFR